MMLLFPTSEIEYFLELPVLGLVIVFENKMLFFGPVMLVDDLCRQMSVEPASSV